MTIVRADLATLSIGEGAASVEVGGLRRHTLTLTRPLADITTTEGRGWRACSSLRAGAEAELRCEGVFLPGPAHAALRTAFLGGSDEWFTLHLPADGTWAGRFFVLSLAIRGQAEEEEIFTLRLASTGPLAFTQDS